MAKFAFWNSLDEFTEGVTFMIPVTDEMMSWWGDEFGNQKMLPKDVCNFLSQGLQYDQNFKISTVDVRRSMVRLEIEATDTAGEVYFTGRSVEFIERQVHLNAT